MKEENRETHGTIKGQKNDTERNVSKFKAV